MVNKIPVFKRKGVSEVVMVSFFYLYNYNSHVGPLHYLVMPYLLLIYLCHLPSYNKRRVDTMRSGF